MLSSSIKINGDTASLCAPTRWAYKPSAHRLAQRTISSNSLSNEVQRGSSNRSDDSNSAVGTTTVLVSRALRLVLKAVVAAFRCRSQSHSMIEVTRICRSYMSEIWVPRCCARRTSALNDSVRSPNRSSSLVWIPDLNTPIGASA